MKKLLQNNILVIKGNSVTLVILSDWHVGSKACDMKLIRATLNYIKRNKNVYVIILGDLLDMVTYHSKGLVGEQELLGTDQFKTVVNLLKPIRDRILFAITGNHENRTVKESATDVMDLICFNLGIEYAGFEKLFCIKVRESFIKCFAHHGAGGGTTPAGKLNALLKLHWRFPDANIIFGGHTHDNVDPQKLIPFIDRTGNIKHKVQQYVSAGSALRSDIGYAAQGAYPPTPTCMKIVRIDINKSDGNRTLLYTITKIQ